MNKIRTTNFTNNPSLSDLEHKDQGNMKNKVLLLRNLDRKR